MLLNKAIQHIGNFSSVADIVMTHPIIPNMLKSIKIRGAYRSPLNLINETSQASSIEELQSYISSDIILSVRLL